MQQITQDYLEGLKAVWTSPHCSQKISNFRSIQEQHIEIDHDKFNDQIFQILTFDLDKSKSVNDVQPRLIYGTKKQICTKYKLDSLSFPSKGAEVKDNFVSILSNNDDDLQKAQYATVRFLLQSRLLSQLLSYTWLDDKRIPDDQKIKIKLVRKILDSYNIIPETFWLDQDKNKENVNNLLEKKLEQILEENSRYVIKPHYASYSSISLALLLSGHAYYKLNNKWTNVYPAIFSNFEMVYEYQLDISWDTFYASRIDLSQSGKRRAFPFTKVTLGYPPRPSEFSIPQENIEKWVKAKEEGNEDETLSFYLHAGSDEKEIGSVVPPYPYLPLSSC